MAEGSIYGVVRKIDLRPVRLELKCGFRILTQVVDILFFRRRMLYPAELQDRIQRVLYEEKRCKSITTRFLRNVCSVFAVFAVKD